MIAFASFKNISGLEENLNFGTCRFQLGMGRYKKISSSGGCQCKNIRTNQIGPQTESETCGNKTWQFYSMKSL